MRVLQAPVNIANQAWGLAQGLRARGHEVEVWEYGTSVFDYPCDRRIDVTAGPEAYVAALHDAFRGGFDVVHLHYARSLVPERIGLPAMWDLPMWRGMGVTVVMTFHGTDVRLRSHHIADDEWSFYRFSDMPSHEDVIADRLRIIRSYASHMTVGSVLDLAYAEDAVYVPKVIDTSGLVATPLPTDGRRPLVVHAPSRRALKGTDMIVAGLDRLRAEGVEFDLDLIEGVSNAEALARMSRADIVVEKVLGGDVGVTSMEAMALGRVAVARIRDQVRERHPDLPVVSAAPDTFADVMRDLLGDPERRARLGRAGPSYVEREHGVEVTGLRLEELYQRPGRSLGPGYPGWPLPSPEARLAATERQVTVLRAALQRRRERVRKLKESVGDALAERDEALRELEQLDARLGAEPARGRWARRRFRRR
ncbi:glycosyltransferase family 4 protein [Pimelobacter simplex]|uniref:glycosyltransferase family 4 protein n=1 Tax=Nocardioides simplex TaxID=2045 RepID=UPI00215024AC|nr:glycosyltransferase family 4 protein [Pimelobacter simplex]UUW91633.1 glycosyltransferase family 4 protein [Pimelobacter simplex]UUW95461.1 glycosyltransferase family 4 protein [Pimelobacter simplex]